LPIKLPEKLNKVIESIALQSFPGKTRN